MKKRRRIIIIAFLLIMVLGYIGFKLVSKYDFKDKIAIIQINKPIGISTYLDDGLNVDKILNDIKNAKDDERVKGIIIEINSPGGSVVASEEIANAVKSITKPKVALIREVGASGAYWIASSADYIVADPMSVTGSIGVIGSYLDFSGLLEEYNVRYHSLKAGKYKDAGSPYKNLTMEEEKLLQSKIDKIYDYFVESIAENRNISKERAIKLADGGIYLGIEAKENGLVDYLGNKEFAINLTKKLANISEANLAVYEEEETIFDMLRRLSKDSFYSVGRGIGSILAEREEFSVRV